MTVTVIRHKRRKRVAFFVTPDGIELRIPARLPNRVVETILTDHADWIAERLAALPKRDALPDDRLNLHGETFPLVKRNTETRFRFDGENFHCPAAWDDSSLRKAYEAWLRERALTYVTESAPYYERLLGVKASRIRIGHQKTRWGSCSSTGTISINVRLMLAPREVMDYVIAHEWAHLVHFDHSKGFWSTLASVYPDVAGAMAWLKQYGHTLQIKKPN
ncbi:M48 family metallopeptidase [Exiguobacterium sp. AM39-5BH]|uniref:M48 family metallopeptidase n=1 Tax=Exiguobacterium sp. AM39-5BH TaxID=2292355 RepID=UPI000FE1AFC8|nr:SprT family zinc-dependent metalloprotease [Exiguobacterium sp. AM39-5BH]RHB52052.1 M48 family peptidase [Exiguobacterium sp. AM39-5BH]